jgi:purine-cytosine permease-like protein
MLNTAFSVTTGLLGPLFRGLSVRDSCLTILFFGALAGLGPATSSTLGPRTGMRQVVQSRYSYGAYAVDIIVLLILASSVGWTIINSIVAGQTLSALSQGSMSWALGIGLAALISLVVAFMGYKVLHLYQRFAWIHSFIALLILAGCGASRLKIQNETPPATAYDVLSCF